MRVLADPLVICVDRDEHLGGHVFGIGPVAGVDPRAAPRARRADFRMAPTTTETSRLPS